MKTRYTVALSMLAGVAVGAAAIQGLHAQAGKKVYLLSQSEILDKAATEDWNKTVREALSKHGGTLVTADTIKVLYRVPEIVTRGRFPDGGESDSTWRTQEARHVGSDTIAPGF